jgi:hypothetical protein
MEGQATVARRIAASVRMRSRVPPLTLAPLWVCLPLLLLVQFAISCVRPAMSCSPHRSTSVGQPWNRSCVLWDQFVWLRELCFAAPAFTHTLADVASRARPFCFSDHHRSAGRPRPLHRRIRVVGGQLQEDSRRADALDTVSTHSSSSDSRAAAKTRRSIRGDGICREHLKCRLQRSVRYLADWPTPAASWTSGCAPGSFAGWCPRQNRRPIAARGTFIGQGNNRDRAGVMHRAEELREARISSTAIWSESSTGASSSNSDAIGSGCVFLLAVATTASPPSTTSRPSITAARHSRSGSCTAISRRSRAAASAASDPSRNRTSVS